MQEPKKSLDAIAGSKKSNTVVLQVAEDSYVEAGESSKKNFGASELVDFKGMAEAPSALYRVPLLKFDISALLKENIVSATLMLNCTLMEDKYSPTTVHVHGCSNDWNENEVTYETRPSDSGYISTSEVRVTGEVCFAVTDYLRRCQQNGDGFISFCLEGDKASVRRLYFSSKESKRGGAKLVVFYGDAAYSTGVSCDGENPWERAMDNVSDWLERWEKIKECGDSDVKTVEKRDSEFSLVMDATYGSETDGYNTRYRHFDTRLISTLENYTPSCEETELYDEYGGYTGGEKFEATGYFYTKKSGDRWWTVDPLGNPFYRVACVQICQGSKNQKVKLLDKHGSSENWAQQATDRFRQLGFNSVGGWSEIHNLIKAKKPLAQTKILYLMVNYANRFGLNVSTAGHTELLNNIMPVFDPKFEEMAYEIAERELADYVGAPEVYGWMSDNELPCDMNMLDNSLKSDPNDARVAYSYTTAWTYMYLKTGKTDVTLNDVDDELRREYRAMVYDKYFSIARGAIKRYAPMHQFIGCRFVDNCFKDERVMRVTGQYCDVITFNYYCVWQGDPQLLANMQRWAGKPFAVTEWYAKGMDVWEKDNRITNTSGAGWTVRTQADRGRFYQNYTLRLLECKGCVGFDWFQYWDNDPEDGGADLSNRNSNKGFLDNNAEEYTGLTEFMGELNCQKYRLIKFFDER